MLFNVYNIIMHYTFQKKVLMLSVVFMGVIKIIN